MFAKLKSWLVQKFTRRPQRHMDFSFDGRTIGVDLRTEQRTLLNVEDIYEVGIETTDTGPFIEDVYWLINRDQQGLRIPQNSPVFDELMDYFKALERFDWSAFADAMCCTDCRYFLCWKTAAKTS